MANDEFSMFIDDVVASLVPGTQYQAHVRIEEGNGRRYGSEIPNCTRVYEVLGDNTLIDKHEVGGVTIDSHMISEDNNEETALLLRNLGNGVRANSEYAGIKISDTQRGYFTLTANPSETKTDLSKLMRLKYPVGDRCTKELTKAALSAYPQIKDPRLALQFYTNAHQD